MTQVLYATNRRGHARKGGRVDPNVRWLMAFPLLFAILMWAATAGARSTPDSFADLAENLLPVVVNISTSQAVDPARMQEFEEFFRDFFERRGEGQPPPEPRRRQSSLGSGFIIDSTGYVVTNHHVVADAEEVTVLLQDDTELKATVVGSDEKTDLAVLKVESTEALPAAKWGKSENTRIGDWVLAIGNPFGLGGSVTAGIVSARARDINAGPYDDFIQTDAAINRGNSGGPMFNLDGEVIGVNTAIFSPSGGSIGIGFAIPSELARNVVEQLREFGTVKRGWLGVRIQTVTDELAEGLRLDEPRGALVASVNKGSPAAKAGIQQGDVILEFAGRDVTDMRRLPRIVAETRIGQEVDVVVWRQGKEETFRVKVAELDEEEVAALTDPEAVTGEDGSMSDLGLSLSSLTPELRQRFQLDEQASGVVVTEVVPDGTAAEKGLRAGDVIVEVDQEQVNNPSDVAARVKKAKDEGYRVVTLLLFRQGDFQWVAVRIDKS